jgi:hypothetical protein
MEVPFMAQYTLPLMVRVHGGPDGAPAAAPGLLGHVVLTKLPVLQISTPGAEM